MESWYDDWSSCQSASDVVCGCADIMTGGEATDEPTFRVLVEVC